MTLPGILWCLCVVGMVGDEGRIVNRTRLLLMAAVLAASIVPARCTRYAAFRSREHRVQGAALLARIPQQGFVVLGLAGSLLVTFMLTSFGSQRGGWFDSGNRMPMHVLPTPMWLLMLKTAAIAPERMRPGQPEKSCCREARREVHTEPSRRALVCSSPAGTRLAGEGLPRMRRRLTMEIAEPCVPARSNAPDGIAPFPDFFVVGAPRCGTTALCRCLSQHPQVCFSKPKEPHYFTQIDARHLRGAEWRSEYARFFTHYREGHRAVGEGSVSYLYFEETLEHITRINPKARFIAMLRNPLKMLPSYHLRMLFILEEDVERFATAWALQEARARGERIPKLCSDPRLLLYGEVGRLGDQVDRMLRTAGRENCLLLLHDDLARDPRGVYRQTLRFIGVDDDGRTQFPNVQPSRHYRNRWLQRLVYKPPVAHGSRFEERLARAAYKAKGQDPKNGPRGSKPNKPLSLRLHKRLRKWNSVVAEPRPLDERMRAILREHFAADVEKLAKLIDRDLGHWL